MHDTDKTKRELLDEITRLRQRIQTLEAHDLQRQHREVPDPEPDGVIQSTSNSVQTPLRPADPAIDADTATVPQHLQPEVREQSWTETMRRRTDKRLQLALDAAQIVAWDVDLNTNQVVCSDNAPFLWGVQVASGSHFLEMIHPEDRERIQHAFWQAIKEATFYSEEYRIIALDGTIRWLNSQGQLYVDAEGTPERMIGVSMDITDRKQAEAERQQLLEREQSARAIAEAERQRLRSIFTQLPAMFAVLKGANHVFEFANPRFLEVLGASDTMIMGKPALDVIPAQAGHIYCEILDHVYQTGHIVRGEEYQPFWLSQGENDASSLFFNLVFLPLKDPEGHVEGILIHGIEVTNQVQARQRGEQLLVDLQQKEADLKASEESLRLAVESADLGMWDYNLVSGQVLWSDRCLHMLGLDDNAHAVVTYDLFLERVHPDDRHWVNEAVHQSITTGENYTTDFRVVWPDDSVHWLSAIGRVYYDEQGAPMRMAGVAIDITQRKQTEQAQRDAEERLRVAVKNSPLTVFNQDQDLRYTWIYNPTLSYSVEEVLGKRDDDLVSPDEARVLSEIKRHVLTTGMGRREEIKLTQAGKDWYFDLTVEPLRNNANEVIGITCAVVDVSDRKQQETEREQLLANERAARAEAETIQRQLTAIFETSPVGIGFLDHEQRFVAINEALAEINGLSREQHLGHTIPDLFGQSDPDLVQVFQTLYQVGEPFISPQFAMNVPGRGDRRPGYYNVYYLPTSEANGQVAGVLAYVVDVTDRVRLEWAQAYLSEASAVLASSLDYQTTLEQVAQLTVPRLADWCTVHIIEDQTIQQLAVAHVNPAKIEWAKQLRQKYPLNPHDPRGAAYTLRTGEPDLLPDIPDELLVQAARDPEHLEILRQVGFKSVMTVPLRTQDQVFGVISFISAESGKRYDQTDLMLAEELARRASLAIDNARLYRVAQRDRADAEAANRVKDEFLAILSHELRTPLNPILGWSRLLRHHNLDDYQTALALETIERNAKLQAQLIEDLLDISRILQGKLRLDIQPVNLTQTIEAAIETVRLSAEAKSIQIHRAIASGLSPVLGDANRLQQVVWNLLSNAVKFTPMGGHVTIHLKQDGSEAQITISDTGKGIHADFLPHVFEAFRQADGTITRTFGGLGLGLSIVRHLVELHGGTIQAASPGEGQGATFTVRLPMMESNSNPEQDTAQVGNSLDLNGVRVLAVDDDTDSLDLLTFILEEVGAIVSTFSSAEDALSAFPQVQPDVLLSDIGMPKVDGYALMRQIRERSPQESGQIPAIALTAYAGEYDQQQALAAGFQIHIPKPFEPGELVNAIATLLNHLSGT